MTTITPLSTIKLLDAQRLQMMSIGIFQLEAPMGLKKAHVYQPKDLGVSNIKKSM